MMKKVAVAKAPKRGERKEGKMSPQVRAKMDKAETMGFRKGGTVSKKGC